MEWTLARASLCPGVSGKPGLVEAAAGQLRRGACRCPIAREHPGLSALSNAPQRGLAPPEILVPCGQRRRLRSATRRCAAGPAGEGANGALRGAVTVASSAVSAAKARPKRFIRHVEGGGQVSATVTEGSSGIVVELEASLESGSQRPLLLHWGLHRTDSSSWFLLDPRDAPPGTDLANVEGMEAMRTPFSRPALRKALPRAGAIAPTTQTLSLNFDSSLAPFSLDFVLYQPPEGSSLPERYIGGTQSASFAVPVGMDSGSPAPLGATRLPDGSVNFALYSKHAQGVVLCLYGALDTEPTLEIDLEPSSHRTGDVWHVRIPSSDVYSKYGYRCKGDAAWDGGHRFHSRTVLLDPYAKILAEPVAGQEDLPSPAPALGALPPAVEDEFDWENDVPLRIPEEQLVVYRANVGALTIDEASGVPETERGTFIGVARKAKYLHSLGVNAVLLQPVAAFDEEQGSYFPFSFFAPMPAYGIDGDPALAARDMKLMVRELHKWGIEVYLEVVVSNTAEQNDQDPKTISFRGVDHSTYYLTDGNGGQVVPLYGAPNAFNCNHPVVHSLILDALSHWVEEYHVDGFCFCNVQALTTGPHGQPVARPLLLEALSLEPVLAGVKLIANPCSPLSGRCELGQLPHWWRWMELNPRFCTDVRRFLRGSPGQLSAMATRLSGSGDIFAAGRGPAFSLNYVTAFTGLTLADLVSYTVDSQDSWGCGVNGPSEDPLVASTRLQQLRNFLCALFLSLGVPTLVMGDEYGSSKEGKTNQLDWEGVLQWESTGTALAQEVSGLIAALAALRRRHTALERSEFWFAGDITWHGARASEGPAWGDPNSSFLAYSVCVHPTAPTAPAEAPTTESPSPAPAPPAVSAPAAPQSALYVAFNAHQHAMGLELPPPPLGCTWVRVVDTSKEHPEEVAAVPLQTSSYELPHHSVLVLEAQETELEAEL